MWMSMDVSHVEVLWMVTLYLWVRTLLPLLAFVIAWMLLSRLIKARVARLPRVPLNLPEHSSSPRRKDRRIYARKLRRKPGLRTATRRPPRRAAGTSRRCSSRSLR
jgi:hypothetical protein